MLVVDTKMNLPRWTKITAAVGLVAGLLFLLDRNFGIPYAIGYENTSLTEMLSRHDFDSEMWKKVANSNDPIRLKMIDALQRKHRLVGMSWSEIEALLGPPDSAHYFPGYDYVYWLGPERGFISLEQEYLGIRFASNTVVEAMDFRASL